MYRTYAENSTKHISFRPDKPDDIFMQLLIIIFATAVIFFIGLMTLGQVAWQASFALAGTTFSVNVALLLSALIGGCLLLYLLTRLLSLPSQLVEKVHRHKRQRQLQSLLDGFVFYSQGDYKKACVSFSHIGKIPVYQFYAQLFASRAHLRLGQLDAASSALQEALQSEYGDKFSLSLVHAEILIARGQESLALDTLHNLLRTHPDNPRIHTLLARYGEKADSDAQ